MPVAITAFCLLHQDRYRLYYRARLPDGPVAEEVVEAALGDLAMCWPSVLATRCPAAAWRILSDVISAVCDSSHLAAGQDAVHRILPAAQADAVVLCWQLGLTAGDAAEVMGVSVQDVQRHLRLADSRLPKDIEVRLRMRP